MVQITEQLIRKKSEHNEGIIGTLEELSLHQEDVEKIEHLHNWCKNLQILLLQSNLIPKIENLNKLKKLEYLNLAINNIEKIENLEGCESLEKLDLTLNFIGDLESVSTLQTNRYLKHLYLTGNPCTDFDGYRMYVVAKLPQLESLDSTEISRSERIKAQQILHYVEPKIKKAQENYFRFRAQQRERLANPDDGVTDEEFWKAASEHAPETRVEISKRSRKAREKAEEEKSINKRNIKLFSNDGKPLNVNQAKVKFKFNDEESSHFVLDVTVYRYLDTNFIDVDLQPTHVKVSIKGKVFQLVLPEEIYVDKSTAQRSQTTGHLVIKMPKVNYETPLEIKTTGNNNKVQLKDKEKITHKRYLEVGHKDESLDFSRIVENNTKQPAVVDDDIPPLEYGCFTEYVR